MQLTVTEGMLRIEAERRVEDRQKTLEPVGDPALELFGSAAAGAQRKSEKYLRQEIRVGSFTRVPPLPEGVIESDVTANYKDGILDIRIPLPEPPPAEEHKKITVTRA